MHVGSSARVVAVPCSAYLVEVDLSIAVLVDGLDHLARLGEVLAENRRQLLNRQHCGREGET